MVSMDCIGSRNDEFSHHVSILCSQGPWTCEKTISWLSCYSPYGWYIAFSSICFRNSTYVWHSSMMLKRFWINYCPWKNTTSTPYHYLGSIVNRQHITPQLIQIRVDKLSTLNDFQKLLGDINWIWPSLGIAIPKNAWTTAQLHSSHTLVK